MSDERTLLVDASVFITLAEVRAVDLLLEMDGTVRIPVPVANEITSDPAATRLEELEEAGLVGIPDAGVFVPAVEAASYLGRDLTEEDLQGKQHKHIDGDVALLAFGIEGVEERRDLITKTSPVVVADDKPLRQTCKSLSIPVSGSIGVLIRAVERDDLAADDAKAMLEAMDEVGARLSASLYRKAERLIEDAADE